MGTNCTILYSKADDPATGIITGNPDRKPTQPLSITAVSNRLFIQMPDKDTRQLGKDLRVSLFNTSGRKIYVYTNKMKMKVTAGKFNIPLSGLSRGVYHVKITNGKDFNYSGSVVITK